MLQTRNQGKTTILKKGKKTNQNQFEDMRFYLWAHGIGLQCAGTTHNRPENHKNHDSWLVETYLQKKHGGETSVLATSKIVATILLYSN